MSSKKTEPEAKNNNKDIAERLRTLADYIEKDSIRICEGTTVEGSQDTVAKGIGMWVNHYHTGRKSITVTLELEDINIKIAEQKRYLKDMENPGG